MANYKFDLYIAGNGSRSQQAVTQLKKICEEAIPNDYELSVIDVLERPEDAEESRILATPTLIRRFPTPVKRIIGDLEDKNTVMQAMELKNNIFKE